MGPRKKSRPNPVKDKVSEAENNQSKAAESKAVTPDPEHGDKTPPQPDTQDVNTAQVEPPLKEVKARDSWYGSVGKTWPRLNKSTASIQLARESIHADKPKNDTASVDLTRFEPMKVDEMKKPDKMPTLRRPPSMLLGKSRETSSISSPIIEGQSDKPKSTKSLKSLTPSETTDGANDKKLPEVGEDSEAKPKETATASVESNTTKRPVGWLEWMGVYGGGGEQAPIQTDIQTDIQTEAPKPATEISEETISAAASNAEISPEVANTPEPAKPTRSWFSLWSSTASPVTTEAVNEQVPVKLTPNETEGSIEEAAKDTAKGIAEEPAKEAALVTDKPSVDPKAPNQPPAGSSWAFWSREDGSKPTLAGEPAKEPIGELAVAGEDSQTNPEPAKATNKPPPSKKEGKLKLGKRGRAILSDTEDQKSSAAANPSAKPTPSQSPAPSTAKALPPDLLLPSFNSTYRLMENPSIIEQIRRILMKSRQPPTKHLHLIKDPPKIKRALAIGVHGLFPAPLLRTVIGQPTGTSIRFAENGSQAIRRFTESHGYECEIEKVALEGEGKIGDRVDNLWKLLLNWIDHVRDADFIFFCCHSQGVPVSIMLVAKLIEFGVVSSARIGVCAMAGVSLGPFADYKSRLFSGSAGELFDFANPESTVSKRYVDALRVALQYGTRITYCGSIDDQLVSMESSTFTTVNHPYIYRAVFIDGRIHAADFLTHLVGFALKLRNLGISDHGLIRELSAPLAGSLYGGEGHSRLYDDGNVYDMAIQHSLETTNIPPTPLHVQSYTVPTNSNPYILPWSMRGLLEEDFVKTELHSEATRLLEQFDAWKPTTKVLKDVKFRLEAVRSKL